MWGRALDPTASVARVEREKGKEQRRRDGGEGAQRGAERESGGSASSSSTPARERSAAPVALEAPPRELEAVELDAGGARGRIILQWREEGGPSSRPDPLTTEGGGSSWPDLLAAETREEEGRS